MKHTEYLVKSKASELKLVKQKQKQTQIIPKKTWHKTKRNYRKIITKMEYHQWILILVAMLSTKRSSRYLGRLDDICTVS